MLLFHSVQQLGQLELQLRSVCVKRGIISKGAQGFHVQASDESVPGGSRKCCSEREAKRVIRINLSPLQTRLWKCGLMYCALIGSSKDSRWKGSANS